MSRPLFCFCRLECGTRSKKFSLSTQGPRGKTGAPGPAGPPVSLFRPNELTSRELPVHIF